MKGGTLPFSPDNTTAWIADFESVRELRDWLSHHHVAHPVHELNKMWDGFIADGRIYVAIIRGSKARGGRRVEFRRILPTCQHCGVRLPRDSSPVGAWGPGVRPMFTCADCAGSDQATG